MKQRAVFSYKVKIFFKLQDLKQKYITYNCENYLRKYLEISGFSGKEFKISSESLTTCRVKERGNQCNGDCKNNR